MRDWSSEDVEQELRMEQMRADLLLKNVQASSEPWKTAVTVVSALAALFMAIGFALGYVAGHR